MLHIIPCDVLLEFMNISHLFGCQDFQLGDHQSLQENFLSILLDRSVKACFLDLLKMRNDLILANDKKTGYKLNF